MYSLVYIKYIRFNEFQHVNISLQKYIIAFFKNTIWVKLKKVGVGTC